MSLTKICPQYWWEINVEASFYIHWQFKENQWFRSLKILSSLQFQESADPNDARPLSQAVKHLLDRTMFAASKYLVHSSLFVNNSRSVDFLTILWCPSVIRLCEEGHFSRVSLTIRLLCLLAFSIKTNHWSGFHLSVENNWHLLSFGIIRPTNCNWLKKTSATLSSSLSDLKRKPIVTRSLMFWLVHWIGRVLFDWLEWSLWTAFAILNRKRSV